MKYGRRSGDFKLLKVVIGVCILMLVLLVSLTFLPESSSAQDVSPIDPPKITTPQPSNAIKAYPEASNEYNKDHLMIYLVTCQDGMCYGPGATTLGEEAMVAKELPVLPYALYQTPGYQCTFICWDADHHVVGSNPLRFGGPWKANRP